MTTKTNPAEFYTVEMVRYGPGDRQEEEVAFTTRRQAEEFAYRMLCGFYSRCWINNIEFTRQDFKESNL